MNPLLIISLVGQSGHTDTHVWSETYVSSSSGASPRYPVNRQTLTEPCYVTNDEIEVVTANEDRNSLCLSSSRCTELSEMKFSENDKVPKKPRKSENETRNEGIEAINIDASADPMTRSISLDRTVLAGIAV